MAGYSYYFSNRFYKNHPMVHRCSGSLSTVTNVGHRNYSGPAAKQAACGFFQSIRMRKISTTEILQRRQKPKENLQKVIEKQWKFSIALWLSVFWKLDISVDTGDHFKVDNQCVQGILKQPRAGDPCVTKTNANAIFTDTALSPRC